MKLSTLTLGIVFVLSIFSCSSDDDDDGGDTGTTGTTDVPVYEDPYLKITYPDGWTEDYSAIQDWGTLLSWVTLLEPVENEMGLNPFCEITSRYLPDTDVLTGLDNLVDFVFSDDPEPIVMFPNINGTTMVRIIGVTLYQPEQFNVTASQRRPFNTAFQIAVEDDIRRQVICGGGMFTGDINYILDSMEVF